MKNRSILFSYFSKEELALWFLSMLAIIIAFCLFDQSNYLTLIASLIGVTSLIFNAKGNPFGQFLMIIFSLLYGIISFTFSYYGEMLTYANNLSFVQKDQLNLVGYSAGTGTCIATYQAMPDSVHSIA